MRIQAQQEGEIIKDENKLLTNLKRFFTRKSKPNILEGLAPTEEETHIGENFKFSQTVDGSRPNCISVVNEKNIRIIQSIANGHESNPIDIIEAVNALGNVSDLRERTRIDLSDRVHAIDMQISDRTGNIVSSGDVFAVVWNDFKGTITPELHDFSSDGESMHNINLRDAAFICVGTRSVMDMLRDSTTASMDHSQIVDGSPIDAFKDITQMLNLTVSTKSQGLILAREIIERVSTKQLKNDATIIFASIER